VRCLVRVSFYRVFAMGQRKSKCFDMFMTFTIYITPTCTISTNIETPFTADISFFMVDK
jgi:hypothetical protein